MHKRNFLILLVLLLSLVIVGGSLAAPAPAPATPLTKQVAAPPDDMAQLQLPDPAQSGVRSGAAMIPVHLEERRDGVWQWRGVLPADGSEFSLLALAPEPGQWTVALKTSDGRKLTPQITDGALGLAEGDSYQGDLLTVDNVKSGPLSVVVTSAAPNSFNGTEPDGYLVATSNSPYHAYAHLSSYNLVAGQDIGLAAYLYDDALAAPEGAPAPLGGVIATATMRVNAPDGQNLTITMADDGRHADGAAGDGVFGGLIPAAAPGTYTAQIVLNGTTPDGQAFMRTSEHVFPVVTPSLRLSTRAAQTAVTADNNLRLNLNAYALTETTTDVQVSAEVWGRNSEGMTPVAWIGGIVTPQPNGHRLTLPLELNGGWLALADVKGGLELRNVTVSDMATHIPIAQLNRLRLRVIALPEQANANGRTTAVTDEMLMGAAPTPMKRTAALPTYVGGSKLMLVHGYCSEGSWPTSHFTDYTVFQDYNQNRTHDEFANLIRDFGSQYDSFGIVAHSQGGAASLHLYTYYWSGLDYSSGSRLIQSVGTPYQGTSLAGSLALIGEIFGAGCGTNWDLTYDGAALWLSGIPSWARSRIYYYTTSFTDKWWRYDYCNIATDLFLDDPDDGVIEKWAGQLSGANNMGHKTGWCHTTDMRDPGQTTDYSRNYYMNLYANR